LREDVLLSKKGEWEPMLAAIGDWPGWLSVEEEPKCLDVLRQHVEKGLPCGADAFVQALGKKIGIKGGLGKKKKGSVPFNL